ncbi:hypothetical protein K466DRAFT_593032 [Polyporus arcularius HHB13444]|uniref:Uncharacterized protein n=1 Tax=Polyporus arcularius HHB13444 TaxID=1314778 RepID=A0A5C3NKK9_9APHY|nr:hypothetical protein K466DRAFT_593032 [Polyporus arcularius HHB13444]
MPLLRRRAGDGVATQAPSPSPSPSPRAVHQLLLHSRPLSPAVVVVFSVLVTAAHDTRKGRRPPLHTVDLSDADADDSPRL